MWDCCLIIWSIEIRHYLNFKLIIFFIFLKFFQLSLGEMCAHMMQPPPLLSLLYLPGEISRHRLFKLLLKWMFSFLLQQPPYTPTPAPPSPTLPSILSPLLSTSSHFSFSTSPAPAPPQWTVVNNLHQLNLSWWVLTHLVQGLMCF